MADGNMINPLVDVMAGALGSVFLKGLTGTALAKVGVTDVDTQRLSAGAVTFGVGFLARNRMPALADGVMGGAVALTTKDLLTKFNLGDDFGLSKMGTTPPPATQASGYLAGPRGYANLGMNRPVYSRAR